MEIVECLTTLAKKSAVSVNVSGSVVRYRRLNTTRAYLLERLKESGEFKEIACRHEELSRHTAKHRNPADLATYARLKRDRKHIGEAHDIFVEGLRARITYLSLRISHERALHGTARAGCLRDGGAECARADRAHGCALHSGHDHKHNPIRDGPRRGAAQTQFQRLGENDRACMAERTGDRWVRRRLWSRRLVPGARRSGAARLAAIPAGESPASIVVVQSML
jgi:hypothetical protein